MSQRVSIIGSTTSVGAPSWRDDELQAFEKLFLEEGVISGLAVSQHAAGANMSVDVAVGHALVEITNTNLTAGQTYKVYVENLALEVVSVTTADATNPRKDRLILEVLVNTNPDAASTNVGRLRLIAGTPAGSPSAPAEPSNCLTLAIIDIPASDTTIGTAQITDSRVYATLDTAVLQDVARQSNLDTNFLRKDKTVFNDFTEKTIVSGAITVTGPLHTVDTESDAGTDDLDTITAQIGSGEFLHLKAENTARTVVIKNGTGNILLSTGADFSLDDTEKSITLIRKGSNWHEVARGQSTVLTATDQPDPVKYKSLTASTAVGASSVAEADIDQNYSIGANELTINSSYEILVRGIFSIQAGHSLTIRVKIGSVTLFSLAGDGASARTSANWTVAGYLTVQATGASGKLTYALSGNVGSTTSNAPATALATLDTTTANTLKATAQFDVSHASNSARSLQVVFRQLT